VSRPCKWCYPGQQTDMNEPSAVDPDYIRSLAVPYKRLGSGVSVYSVLSGTKHVIQRQRPKTAAEVTPSARAETSRLLMRERTGMLDELMFLYGRNVSGSFDFSRTELRKKQTDYSENVSSSNQNSPWQIRSNASLQLNKASNKYPRHRTFTTTARPVTRQ